MGSYIGSQGVLHEEPCGARNSQEEPCLDKHFVCADARDLAIIHRRLCTQLCACKRLPTALRRSQEVSARKSQEDPRGASSRQEEPGGRKGTQEEPGKPRRSQGNPGGARRTQEGPGKPRRSQGNPGGARETQEIPGGTMQGESGGTQDDPGPEEPGGTRRDPGSKELTLAPRLTHGSMVPPHVF
jgi:hypothetical protein